MNFFLTALRRHSIALLALFVALSGSAYATAQIGGNNIKRNAIATKHLKRASVGAPQIKRSAVRATHVANGQIQGRHVRPGQIQGRHIGSGQIEGRHIAPGVIPAPTPPGLGNVEVIESPWVSVPSGYSSYEVELAGGPGLTAQCPPGKVAIGTGHFSSLAHTAFVSIFGTSVSGFVFNDSLITLDVSVQAVCASPGASLYSSTDQSEGRAEFERQAERALVAVRAERG